VPSNAPTEIDERLARERARAANLAHGALSLQCRGRDHRLVKGGLSHTTAAASRGLAGRDVAQFDGAAIAARQAEHRGLDADALLGESSLAARRAIVGGRQRGAEVAMRASQPWNAPMLRGSKRPAEARRRQGLSRPHATPVPW